MLVLAEQLESHYPVFGHYQWHGTARAFTIRKYELHKYCKIANKTHAVFKTRIECFKYYMCGVIEFHELFHNYFL